MSTESQMNTESHVNTLALSAELRAFKRGVEEGLIRAIDYQFAKFIVQTYGINKEGALLLFWTAYLVSKAQSEKHVCVDLAPYAGKTITVYAQGPKMSFPTWAKWSKALLSCKLVAAPSAIGCDGDSNEQPSALVLDGSLCYLARYWRYEQQLALLLLDKKASHYIVDEAELDFYSSALQQLFPKRMEKVNETAQVSEVNWQQVACALALMQKLAVITGGPGTGKTTTVIRLLALLILSEKRRSEQSQATSSNIKILLAAPTGKAAVRMSESIRLAKQGLNLDEELKALIPEQASTIHRLLGSIPKSIEFRHNAHRPLNADLLVLDEASMVDLPMMLRLLSALPKSCRVIMLGDKDQLSSVEAGSILADLCSSITVQKQQVKMNYSKGLVKSLSALCQSDLAAHEFKKAEQVHSQLADCICMLQKSYRFAGGIGELATAVNNMQPHLAFQLLEDASKQDIALYESCEAKELQERIVALATQQYKPFFAVLSEEPAEVIRAFEQFRVLCASRLGPLGTQELNNKIQQSLKHSKVLSNSELFEQEFFPGRPVMISRNDYNVRLFNGDTGIVLPSIENEGELRVYFLQADNSVRAVLPSRLPPHETAFAMTIHKSQGSEFKEVALALAVQSSVRGMTKEVIYTGITRAKEKVSIFSDRMALKQGIEQKTIRQSGLKNKLTLIERN